MAPKKGTRRCTIWDAFADKIAGNGRGFVSQEGTKNSIRRRIERIPTAGPDEALEVRTGVKNPMPSADQQKWLPEGNTLLAIHYHCSRLFEVQKRDERTFSSMDETAIIAIDIFLEETSKYLIGDSGDMALALPNNESSDTDTESEDEAESGNDEEDELDDQMYMEERSPVRDGAHRPGPQECEGREEYGEENLSPGRTEEGNGSERNLSGAVNRFPAEVRMDLPKDRNLGFGLMKPKKRTAVKRKRGF